MTIPKIRTLFGTDGIRGKANVYPMTGEVAFSLGRAVTAYFQRIHPDRRPTIIIGKDTRRSCYMLEQAFSSGVCSQGGSAILTGPLPTPGVAFVTQSMRAQAGVMISASHNSFEDNGIKIFDPTGHKLPDEVEWELEQMVLNPNLIEVKTGGELGNAKRLDEVVGRYIVNVKSALDPNCSLEGWRLVVDGANGAGYKVAPLVFEELGAEVIRMGNTPNGTNINHEVGALHPETCRQKVIEYRADLGICLDGDGDRLVIIDSEGHIIPGDQLIAILADHLLKQSQLRTGDEVVGTVMSNFGLEKYLVDQGLKLQRTKVGDRYIVEHMKAKGAIFGGEPSGHLIFKNYSTTGDGILAALKVIESLIMSKSTLQERLKECPLYPQKLVNVKVKEKKPLDMFPVIQEKIKDVENQLNQTGRVLLRYSGTENLLRVMVEGPEEETVDTLSKDLARVIEKELN